MFWNEKRKIRLKDKNAVVTGSTGGIGLAIARELAANGANVVINGFGDANAIEKERINIELEFDVKAHYINADLMQAQATRDFIEQSVKVLGSIDILVNNAGIQHTDLKIGRASCRERVCQYV